MHESPRVKRTSVGNDIYVTKHSRRKKCKKISRPFIDLDNVTVEIRAVEIEGLPNILPPDYPIVPNCKVKRS